MPEDTQTQITDYISTKEASERYDIQPSARQRPPAGGSSTALLGAQSIKCGDSYGT